MKANAQGIKDRGTNKFAIGSVLLSMLLISSCEEFVKIDPPNSQLTSTVVFESDATATAAVTGIYSKMMDGLAGTLADYSVTIYGGLSADELMNRSTNANQGQFYTNSLTITNSSISAMWSYGYQYIYMANAVIEGLAASTAITPALSQQLQGEAKFIRAFSHFYLTNLYGDVPYVKTTDYAITANVSRDPQSEVYQQIIADLLEAQSLLSNTYVTTEKVRPNKFTATALLARAYLYTGDWANASTQASAIINSGAYSLNPLSGIFLKNSNEAIWQLMPVLTGQNTYEASVFIPLARPTNVTVSDSLRNAFEVGDARKTSWIGSITVSGLTYYYPYKYKVKSGATLSEYYMVFRLAEQYLIRAEAAAQLNNISQAVSDLNVIRSRAGLANLPTTLSQAQCFAAIEKERRIELLCEWGHRWLDLKRTGRADAVLGPIKSNWQSTDALFPIPQAVLTNDPNMVQNPGY